MSATILSMAVMEMGRFSQAFMMPSLTLFGSKVWREPSFLTTRMGVLSTVS